MKTVSLRTQDAQRNWCVVDAENRTLGRLASAVALRLPRQAQAGVHAACGRWGLRRRRQRGKGARHRQQGAGQKLITAIADIRRHQGHQPEEAAETHPERIIEKAVKGMLPRNPLGRAVFRKLKVYAGPAHPHAAQQPEPVEI